MWNGKILWQNIHGAVGEKWSTRFEKRIGNALAIWDVARNEIWGRIQGLVNLVLLLSIFYGGSEAVGIRTMAIMGLTFVVVLGIMALIFDRLGLVKATINWRQRRMHETPAWAKREFKEIRGEIEEMKKWMKQKH